MEAFKGRVQDFCRATWSKEQLYSLGLGQVISILITGTGTCSQLLAQKYSVNAPTSQSFLNYILLAIAYGILVFGVRRRPIIETLRSRLLVCLPLALVDVEANYLVVKAYQYTSITSVMLLDCFTIPVALGLTYIFLKTRYNLRHLIGVGLCLAGLGLLIYDDAAKNDSVASGSNPILGDLFCLAGAILYAISNVGQEASVKAFDWSEYLAIIGLFGTGISGIQLAIFERSELQSIEWSTSVGSFSLFPGAKPSILTVRVVVLLIVGFGVILFVFYSLVPFMLKHSGSTLFNLSLLTSDAYAIIVGIFLFNKSPSAFYFIALAIIVVGLLLYNVNNQPTTAEATGGYEEVGKDGEGAGIPTSPQTPLHTSYSPKLPPPTPSIGATDTVVASKQQTAETDEVEVSLDGEPIDDR